MAQRRDYDGDPGWTLEEDCQLMLGLVSLRVVRIESKGDVASLCV